MAGDMEVRFLIQKEGGFWRLYTEHITASAVGLSREAADVGKQFFSADEAEAYAINLHGAKMKQIRRGQ